MNRTILLLLCFGFLLLATVVDLAWQYPALPERVATRFGGRGEAIGWSTKAQFLTGQIVVVGLVLVVGIGLRYLMFWVSPRWINVPNRQIWLAPERLARTRSYLADWISVFGLFLLAYVGLLQHLTMRANAAPEPRLASAFWILHFAYLGVGAVIVIQLIWRFRRPR